MEDPRIGDLIKEEAEKMYEESGCLNLWMLSRRIARSINASTEVIVFHLTGLEYVEIVSGTFVLKDDCESPKAKKIRSCDGTAFAFMLSNERARERLDRDSLERNKKGTKIEKIDYSGYRVHELRSIATDKGIKDARFMTKEALIKKIKSN